MNEQHYAVVVGIDHYPGVRNLTSARNDARRFAAWLQREDGGGLPEDNVELILVEDEELPDPLEVGNAVPHFQEIEDALFDLRLRCEDHVADHPLDWQRSRLYLYVSGHGIAPAPDEAALLMANAAPQRFGRNLSCDKFLEFFKAAQTFKELVFLADCCRERVGNANIQLPTWDRVEGHNGQVVALPGYATHFAEVAFEADPVEDEDPDERRSYFTQALLEGLEGKAVNPDGVIDSTSLTLYVTARVQELTAHKPRKQKPEMVSDVATPIIFRTGVPQPAPEDPAGQPVTLRFPAGFAGTVVLTDGTFKKVGTHDAGSGPWSLPLPPGLYEVAPEAGGANPFADHGRIRVTIGGADVQL